MLPRDRPAALAQLVFDLDRRERTLLGVEQPHERTAGATGLAPVLREDALRVRGPALLPTLGHQSQSSFARRPVELLPRSGSRARRGFRR
jgi:hypothetical protein